MKEQVIQIPDTLEIKEIKDGKIILVEKERKLTYEDVAGKLFYKGESHYYIRDDGSIDKVKNCLTNYNLPNNALSKKQLEKLLAINKLMNVAKYLNDGWQPNWNSLKEKYYILCDNSSLRVQSISSIQCLDIYFKSEELAEQAIEILGEETIKLALCTDY